jgi:invasion protein IalB
MIGAAFVLGCCFLLAAGLYGYLTEDDPAPAATTAAPAATRPSTAQMMADLDQHQYPASAYQQQLDSWTAKCAEDEYTLAGYVYATQQDLQQHGRGDTEFKILGELNRSTPAGAGADCKGITAAYLVLREAQ